jgi:hypothetical protein
LCEPLCLHGLGRSERLQPCDCRSRRYWAQAERNDPGRTGGASFPVCRFQSSCSSECHATGPEPWYRPVEIAAVRTEEVGGFLIGSGETQEFAAPRIQSRPTLAIAIVCRSAIRISRPGPAPRAMRIPSSFLRSLTVQEIEPAGPSPAASPETCTAECPEQVAVQAVKSAREIIRRQDGIAGPCFTSCLI